MVGVLIFIHQDVAEPVLVLGQHLGKVAEQNICVQQQVVKIHGARLFAADAVGLVDFTELWPACYVVALGDFGMCLVVLRGNQVVLGPGYAAQYFTGLVPLIVEVHLFDDRFDQAF